MCLSVVLCPSDRCELSVVGSLNAALTGRFGDHGGSSFVCLRLLGRPVGNLPTLQHGPSVSLHVVEQRDDDGRAHQQLETEENILVSTLCAGPNCLRHTTRSAEQLGLRF